MEEAEKYVCCNEGNHNANIVSTQSKPAESLLQHDDREDNDDNDDDDDDDDDEVCSSVSVCRRVQMFPA